MSDYPKTGEEKKTYQKPQVTEVKLVAEEAVLATCKIGPIGGDATNCTTDLTCNSSATS
jgi:hypothetical protein